MPSFVIVTAEADGTEGRSTDMTETAALHWACDLIREGIRVVRIETTDGDDLTEAEILEKCRSRKNRRRIIRQ